MVLWRSQQCRFLGQGYNFPTSNIGKSNIGTSISISSDGNYLAIGGENDNSDVGAVWIFKRYLNTWGLQTKLIGSGAIGAAKQGASVSLDDTGEYVAFGGPDHDSNNGAVWVFKRTTSNGSDSWAELSSMPLTGDIGSVSPVRFGKSLSLLKLNLSFKLPVTHFLVIGAPETSANTGAIWIYQKDGSDYFGYNYPLNNRSYPSINSVTGDHGTSVSLAQGDDPAPSTSIIFLASNSSNVLKPLK